MITLWKASQPDVWCCGDSLATSLQNLVFVMIAVSFSLALVSTYKQVFQAYEDILLFLHVI